MTQLVAGSAVLPHCDEVLLGTAQLVTNTDLVPEIRQTIISLNEFIITFRTYLNSKL